MKYLLDTHIVIWLADEEEKLSKEVVDILTNCDNDIYFSPVNLWEMAIKKRQSHQEFQIDIDNLHSLLLRNDFQELLIKSDHAKQVENLPVYHKDPFDRMLIAQAMCEDMILITQDSKILQYNSVKILKNT